MQRGLRGRRRDGEHRCRVHWHAAPPVWSRCRRIHHVFRVGCHGRADRPARSNRRRQRPAPCDYQLAYFGRYEVDTENELVRHFLEGQVHPGYHPDTLERKYRFYDDKLSLRPNDDTDREILWQRT